LGFVVFRCDDLLAGQTEKKEVEASTCSTLKQFISFVKALGRPRDIRLEIAARQMWLANDKQATEQVKIFKHV